MPSRLILCVLLSLSTLVCCGGCDLFGGDSKPAEVKVKPPKKKPPRRDPAPPPVIEPEVKPAVEALEFSFDPKAKTKTCFAQIIELQRNGPVVLQITSYPAAEKETFPSFLIQARVSGLTPQALAGQEVAAEMYGQLISGGPVFQNSAPGSVKVQIAESPAGVLSGTISGTLVSGDSEEPIDITGSFTARLTADTQ